MWLRACGSESEVKPESVELYQDFVATRSLCLGYSIMSGVSGQLRAPALLVVVEA